jgi:hypothetical protein
MLSDEQFDRARRLALRLTGMLLFERHRELLDRRSRRLGMSDPADFEVLLHVAENGVAAGVYSRRCESSQAGAPTFHNQGMNL